jgi:selenide,water dikinase
LAAVTAAQAEVYAPVLVGAGTSDDAGVYLHDGQAWVATADFITPVTDDARRFGRVAAANALSDVYAMGGRPLFALNLAAFPEPGSGVNAEELAKILEGAAEMAAEAGTAIVGGHTVADPELKFGLSVTGIADPERLLTNAGARAGDRLVLTKPLGTGVLINAFKSDKIDQDGLEPAMVEMERLNATASRLALEHGSRGATDVTGFGLVCHALEMAEASGVTLRLHPADLPVLDGYFRLVERGVTTGSTPKNRAAAIAGGRWSARSPLAKETESLLFDPQTSGPLLISVPEASVLALLGDLAASGHTAREIGRVLEGPGRVETA